MNLSKLNTETRNLDTLDLDQRDTLGILKAINQEDQKVAPLIAEHLEELTDMVDYIWQSFQKGRLFTLGAGTSGRLAVVDSAECPPTFGVDDNKVIGLIAGGEAAFIKAQEGAEDDMEAAEKDLKARGFCKDDVLLGITASGRTPYIIGALKYARSIGAKTLALSNSKDAEISQYADKALELVVGPEVITGSTRMKAGTSQKLVLNMISTCLMIKLGKIYSNLMVDVQPTNEKLVRRAVNILKECLDIEEEVAVDLFEKSGRKVKVALVMSLLDEEAEQAHRLLEEHQQNIAKIIRLYKK